MNTLTIMLAIQWAIALQFLFLWRNRALKAEEQLRNLKEKANAGGGG